MTGHAEQLAIIRGGGSIAAGTIHRLYRCRYLVLVLESGYPSAIRRCVAFSEAIYDGTSEVEEVTYIKASGYEETCAIMEQGTVSVMIDENCAVLEEVRPQAPMGTILARRNLGTTRDMTDKVIGLGPGFTTGQDADLVMGTMRGHNLGHITGSESAAPNTGIPGVIGGYGVERVIHAPAKGIFFGRTLIGDMVEQSQAIGVTVTGQGEVTVEASLAGLLRGIIKDGYPVVKGFKIAGIDPRKSEYESCFTISDKTRCIAGSVVKGLQMLEVEQGY